MMDEWFIPGITIETPAAELRNEAKAAHRQWLRTADIQDQFQYAAALLRYGRYIHSQGMIDHALKLQKEG